jgi:predicted phage replisome organizer
LSDNKKYYYLKLKENFFDSDEMAILESMQDGFIYSNILLKLYLRSLKNEGRLMINDRIPFNSSMLASVTKHSVGDIEKAMKIFKDLNLIEILDNGAIYMNDIQLFIGKSSTEADRIRMFRNKIDKEKSNDVHLSYICTPELEKELELEKEKDINKKSILTDTKKKDFFDVESDFFLDENFSKTWIAFVEMRKKIKKPLTQLAVQRMINKLESYDIKTAEKMIEISIINCWADVYELKQKIEPKIEIPKTSIEKGKELFESYKDDLYFHWNNSTKEEKNIIVEYIKTLDYNNPDRVELRGITEKKANGKLADMISSIGNIENPNKFKILSECKKLYALKLAKEIKDKDSILKIVEQMDYWTADKLNKWLIDNK